MSSAAREGETARMVRVGERAPDFSLLNQAGQPVRLRQFRGQTVVLYFYPRDHTTICTAQACQFRDRFEAFGHANAVILGVSSDSSATHGEFVRQHGLPFHLLADVDGAVRAKYGVPRMFFLAGRVTFVIDREGIVRHIIKSMFFFGRHIREALHAASLLAVPTGPTPVGRP